MMKQFLSILAALLLCSTIAIAQETAPAPAEDQAALTSGPKMIFDAETIDYGVIEQGSDPYRIFTFTNTGDAPLVIKHAKGSCGCTVPTYPKEPIAPGTTGEIKVRYDTNRVGKFTKRVTLTTNVGEEKQMLTIKGEVLKKPDEPAGVPAGENNLFNNNN